MRTPAGKECRYFYGNYHRGRQQEECRLLDEDSQAVPVWTADLCKTCPVPGISMANACATMVLKATVIRPFPFIRRQVRVRAYCTRTNRDGFDPHIGCGECHPLPEIFTEEPR